MKYKGGCRCVPCRAANSRYESERLEARKAGKSNPIIPADTARKHLLKLQRAGIGRRTIHDISGVAENIIAGVRNGTLPNLRRDTEDRILAVTVDAVPDSALVSARPTWKLLNALLGEGLTKRELSRRLGYKRYFQINTKRITAKTAMRVEQFYNRLMLG